MKPSTPAQRWAQERNLGLGRIAGMAAQLHMLAKADFLTIVEKEQCFKSYRILMDILNNKKFEAKWSKAVYLGKHL